MEALLKRSVALAQRSVAQSRNIHIRIPDGYDADRFASRLHSIVNEDGIMKSRQLLKFHEKGWMKRKRKNDERYIRHANRRVGSMIDFILKRKKAGF